MTKTKLITEAQIAKRLRKLIVSIYHGPVKTYVLSHKDTDLLVEVIITVLSDCDLVDKLTETMNEKLVVL